MLFIPLLVCTARSADQQNNKQHSQYVNFGNNGDREVKLDSFDGRGDVEYNSVSFVEASKIFVKEDGIFYGMMSSGSVQSL